MKKAIACVALAAVFLVLGDAHVRSQLREALHSAEPQAQLEEPVFSEQLGGHERTDMLEVALYYRFADTDVLGVERAQLDIRREETVATRIVQRLIDGPGVGHDRLGGLFPSGTRLISVTGEATTAFVTLSSEFLGRPDGAPADWEDSSSWQDETTLRRRLAVQSIALSLTEGGRFQRVQLYIADTDDDVPERVPLAYFDRGTTDPALVLAACPRDEQAMLTPQRAMTLILEAWQAMDWARLYQLLAPAQGGVLPTLSVFEAAMRELDVALLEAETTPGTVSLDGQTATMVVTAQIRTRAGGDAQIVRESVPLLRLRDNWAIGEDTLRSLMIRD